MISIHASTRVFLCSEAINMKYSFDCLAGLVKSHFGMNPACGHLFVFFSRRRDRLKLLFWDSEGFVLYYKRLDRGTFSWLDDLDLSEGGEMDASDFAVILSGVNPPHVRASKKEERRNNVVSPRAAPLQLV